MFFWESAHPRSLEIKQSFSSSASASRSRRSPQNFIFLSRFLVARCALLNSEIGTLSLKKRGTILRLLAFLEHIWLANRLELMSLC